MTALSGRADLFAMVLGAIGIAYLPTTVAATTERVSVDSMGTEGNFSSTDSSISADGRFIAFTSDASNLVAGDTNDWNDVFVHDRQTGLTERVSVSSTGDQADSFSQSPAISSDGRFVAFNSGATNLVVGDTNNWADIFVHDRQTGATERVSVDSAGNQADWSSGGVDSPISADGRFVVFSSQATNLVLGDTNNLSDYFVHDRLTGVTERVGEHATPNGDMDPSISADGRWVAFNSGPSESSQVYIHDRLTISTELVSVDSDEVPADGNNLGTALSDDGRYVAFASRATNLVAGDTNNTFHIYVRDRQASITERIGIDGAGTPANGGSFDPALSSEGRYIAFFSLARNFDSGDTDFLLDIFVRDRQTGSTERVSVDSGGNFANSDSLEPEITPDGRFISFDSNAMNLVSDDTNNAKDVFVRDRQDGPVYEFQGFFSPVDNLPVVNSVKAGSAIPVKFSLGGDEGLDIFASGYPASQKISCDTSAPVDAIEETVTAGSSGLSYDAGSDRYHYVWKTAKAWSNTCRRLILKLDDQSEHVANFKFK